jgi:hypothetical protein
MKTVAHAIRLDGLALARVAPNLEQELTKFGGTDPFEMLKFRYACFPRDTSSWRVLERCVFAVVKRLERRMNFPNISINDVQGPQISLNDQIDMNVFHDILQTLLRRMWMSMMEFAVSH